jgi:DNA-binding GntR family transcriptional regulator
MAARLACQKGNTKFFSNIREIRERIKEIDIERNCQEGVFFGRKLHDLIIATASNTFLSEFYNKLRNITALTRNITQKSVSIEKKSKEAHLAIINALEERDEEKSEYRMREHLRTTCRLMADYFYPNLFK